MARSLQCAAATLLLCWSAGAFTAPKTSLCTSSTTIIGMVPPTTMLRAETSSSNTRRTEKMTEPFTSDSGSVSDRATALNMVEDKQREFEMNVGKAVDTLRNDYPIILSSNPDYSIYHTDLEVVDPTGVTLHGLQNYKRSFVFLHAIINLFYCPENSNIQYRLVYDCARHDIRVSWNVKLIPKAIFGGTKMPLYVDGISIYHVERASGNITQHKVDRLMINDAPVRPKRGIFYALTNEIIEPDSIPVGGILGTSSSGTGSNPFKLEFRPLPSLMERIFQKELRRDTSLFSWSARTSGGNGGNTEVSSSGEAAMRGSERQTSQRQEISQEINGNQMDASSPENSSFDWEAFEGKNASRRRFGLKPLTPEEFLETEKMNEQLKKKQQEKAQAAAAASAAMAAKAAEAKAAKQRKGPFGNFLGNILEDTCESNFDCKRPQICCDFKIKKVCCSSGVFVGQEENLPPNYGKKQVIPVVGGAPRPL